MRRTLARAPSRWCWSTSRGTSPPATSAGRATSGPRSGLPGSGLVLAAAGWPHSTITTPIPQLATFLASITTFHHLPPSSTASCHLSVANLHHLAQWLVVHKLWSWILHLLCSRSSQAALIPHPGGVIYPTWSNKSSNLI